MRISTEEWRIADGKLYLNCGPYLRGDPKEFAVCVDTNSLESSVIQLPTLRGHLTGMDSSYEGR